MTGGISPYAILSDVVDLWPQIAVLVHFVAVVSLPAAQAPHIWYVPCAALHSRRFAVFP